MNLRVCLVCLDVAPSFACFVHLAADPLVAAYLDYLRVTDPAVRAAASSYLVATAKWGGLPLCLDAVAFAGFKGVGETRAALKRERKKLPKKPAVLRHLRVKRKSPSSRQMSLPPPHDPTADAAQRPRNSVRIPKNRLRSAVVMSVAAAPAS